MSIKSRASIVFEPESAAEWEAFRTDFLEGYPGEKSVTFTSDVTVPEGLGPYDFSNTTIRGNGTGQTQGGASDDQIVVTFADGATISDASFMMVEAGARLRSVSTTPVLTVTTGTQIVGLRYGFIESTTAPFFEVTGAGFFILGLNDGSGLNDAGYEVVQATNADATDPSLVITLGTSCYVDADTIRGTPGLYGLQSLSSASLATFPTQTNLTAASTIDVSGYGATGAATGYTPAVTGDWTGADPTTVAAALDRIAAALGPIA